MGWWCAASAAGGCCGPFQEDGGGLWSCAADTSWQWHWKLLVVCNGLRGGADFPYQMCCWPALFSERDAPKEFRGWMVGCLHMGVCFPGRHCTVELLLWLNNHRAVFRECGHRPFRRRSSAAFPVSAEVCLGRSWVRHGCECWRQVLSRSEPAAAPRASSGVTFPSSLGTVGALAAAPAARLSMVSRAASAFQRSLLQGRWSEHFPLPGALCQRPWQPGAEQGWYGDLYPSWFRASLGRCDRLCSLPTLL